MGRLGLLGLVARCTLHARLVPQVLVCAAAAAAAAAAGRMEVFVPFAYRSVRQTAHDPTLGRVAILPLRGCPAAGFHR